MGRERSRLSQLLLALAVFGLALALAAPGLAQSDNPEGPGSSGSEEDYSDTTPSESKQLFAEQFEPTFDSLDSQAQPLGDEKVLEYRGDYVAVVAADPDYQRPEPEPVEPSEQMLGSNSGTPIADGAETPLLALSDTPLRARSESGAKKPLDLTLDEGPGGFEATNPLVPVAASSDAAAGFSIGSGAEKVDVAPAQAAQGASSASRLGDVGVFYPDVASDTDMIVSAIPAGAEVFTQIRSAAAPERFVLDVDVPPGAELRAGAEGSAEIVSGGKVVSKISSPIAFDADGRTITVAMAVEGSSLVLAVEHRQAPVSYPILVDPAIETFGAWTDQEMWLWNRAGSAPNYTDPSDPNGDYYARKQAPLEGCWLSAVNCWGAGLYVYARKNRSFGSTSYAGFVYNPPRYKTFGEAGHPGTTTFVTAAAFDSVRWRANGDSDGSFSPRPKLGIFQDRGASVAPRGIGNSPITTPGTNPTDGNTFSGGLYAWNNSTNNYGGLESGADPLGKQVWFQLAASVTRTTQQLHELHLGSARIFLSDEEAPGASVPQSTLWFKDKDPHSATVFGKDQAAGASYGGLGIKNLQVETRPPDNADLNQRYNPGYPITCDGSNKQQCAIEASRSITYPTNGLPDGINLGYGRATDAAGKEAYPGLFWIKVDRELPKAPTLSGGLLNATGPGNSLTVEGNDLGGSGRDAFNPSHRAAWRSGVHEIKLTMTKAGSSTVVYSDSKTFGCTETLDTCAPVASHTFNPPATLADGDYVCTVDVLDAANNSSSSGPTPCYVDGVPPQTTIDSGPQGLTSDASPTFGFSSSKAGSTFKCELFDTDGLSPSIPVASAGCSSLKTYEQALSDGPYRFEVSATDRKGLPDGSPATRSFTVDATPPETTITSGPSGLTNNKNPSFGFSSSEANSTFQCRLSQTAPTSSTGTWGSCTNPKSYTSLSDGAYTFEVKATDQATNTDPTAAPRSFTVDATPPETTITSGPRGETRDATPTFGFSSSEENSTFECRIDQGAPTSCDSPETFGPLQDGPHVLQVVATDPAGNADATSAIREFILVTIERRAPESGKLGLEQYFHYDSTEAGLSGAHANLATGNLVWQKVPLTNPGRGLSSVLNLTYNSYDYPLLGDIPLDSRFLSLDYDETGIGYSVGLSGVTRVNEPLGGVLIPNVVGASGVEGATTDPQLEPGAVTMTDPDGTTHVFRPDLNNTSKAGSCLPAGGLPTRYEAPPGVNLELRRFGCPTESTGAATEDAVRLTQKVLGSLDPNDPEAPLTRDDFLGLDLDPDQGGPKLWPGQDNQPAQSLGDLVEIPELRDSLAGAFEDLYLLEQDNLWAITRPDGVTYYFNGFGFATKIVDRDDNVLRYVYEKVNPLGEPCDLGLPVGVEPPIVPGLCEPRLSKVIDAAGNDQGASQQRVDERTVGIDYYSLADIGIRNAGSIPLDSLGSAVGGIQAQLGQSSEDVNQLNKIEAISDHAGRRLAFEYDSKGRLETLTEAEGTDAARETDFAYDVPATTDLLAHAQLSSVSEPHPPGSASPKTSFTYDEDRPTLQAGRPVVAVADRDTEDGASAGAAPGADRSYSYTTNDDGNPISEDSSQARVTDGRGTETLVALDRYDRPTSIIEADNVPDDRRTTLLEWDDGADEPVDNNVTKLTVAAGIEDEEAITDFAYDEQNGVLTEQTDPLERTTSLGYCSHNGTQPSAFGTDAGGQFVSDQLSIKRPAGNAWSYELDSEARGGIEDGAYCDTLEAGEIVGHQTAQIDPFGNAANTTYDDKGQIKAEIDELGDKTRYSAYDPSGLPQAITDPEGFDLEASDPDQDPAMEERRHSWLYDYDEVGNVEAVTDPRAKPQIDPPSFPGRDGPFTTTLTYDALNRLTEERIPRNSSSEEGLSGPAFVTRGYGYDSTDNLTSETDEEGARTDISYTPMDRVELERSPAVEVDDGSGTPLSKRLETRYCYDGEETPVRVFSPKALQGLDAEQDGICGREPRAHAMSSRLDSLGRAVATVQEHNSAAEQLVTSYAYDHRDNQLAVKDPNSNEGRSLQQAIVDTREQVNVRIANTYDLANNLTASVEDPGGLELKTTYGYDRNDNPTSVTSPRGYVGGADAADYTSTTTFDARDMPTDVADPLGNKTHYAYDEAGRPISQTDPRGVATSDVDGDLVTRMSYDLNGDLLTRSVPWAEGQYGLDRETLEAPEVRYSRDPIGDPLEITDARGTVVRNTFYDTGELASTNRPWWFRLDWSSPFGNPSAGNRYTDASGGLKADVAVPPGGPQLAEAGMAPAAQGSELPSGPMAGDFGNAQAEGLPDFMPRAGKTILAYDKVGRLESATAAPLGDQGSGEDPASVRSLDYDAIGRITDKRWTLGIKDPASKITHSYTYDANSNLATYVDGAGTASEFPGAVNQQLTDNDGDALNPSDYTTTFGYDPFDRRTSESSPGSLDGPDDAAIEKEVTEWGYDDNGNVTSRITPRGAGFDFSFAYDDVDRLDVEENPIGSTYSYDYDANSNPTTVTNPRGYDTKTVFDRADRAEAVIEAQGTGVERQTAFDLDPAGNVTEVTAPGAKPYQGAEMAERVTRIAYDGIGQAWKTMSGLRADSDDEAMPNESRNEIVQRDQAGNVVRTIRGEGIAEQGDLGAFNSYGDPDDWTDQELDSPTVRATVDILDEDGLRTASYLPHGNGDNELSEDDTRYKLGFAYDARGRLRTLDQAYEFGVANPRTTRVSYNYFNTDWIRSSSDKRDIAIDNEPILPDQSLRYFYDPRGIQTDWITEAYLNERESGRQIKRFINPSGTLFEKRGAMYLADGEQGDEPGEIDSTKRTYSYFYNPNRSLTQIEDLIPAFDGMPQGFNRDRTTLIDRDAAERESRINELWRGEGDWRDGRDTILRYDEANNVTTRRVDGLLYEEGPLPLPADDAPCTGDPSACEYRDGRTTTFTYDPLDRESTMDVGDRHSKTTWWPSDELATRTKLNGTEEDPGTLEQRYYLRSGAIARKIREPEEGAKTTQTYAYDLDGNRTFDERGAHTFNARQQLVRWDKPSSESADDGYGTHKIGDDVVAPGDRNYASDPANYPESGYVTYTLDGTGQTLATHEERSFAADLSNGSSTPTQVIVDSDYTYEDGYLKQVESEATPSFPGRPEIPAEKTTTKAFYESYDDLGNVGQIRTETVGEGDPDPPPPDDQTPTAPGCPASTIERWSDPETTYHCFDELGRLVASQGADPDDAAGDDERKGEDAEAWIYDGLDRRDARLVTVDGQIEARERSYIGTTELLSREADEGDSGPMGIGGGPETKTYEYDSQGMRVGQEVRKESILDPTERYSAYDHDAAGSVIGLEDEQGTFDDPDSPGADADNHYDYDPYGALQDPEPGNPEGDAEAELPEAAQENPFRYEGFYYDSGIQSYDMQARQYRPDVGRFLSQDRFEAAGADLALQSDPLTQNRYAFAGGNPVSNIEWDGHRWGLNIRGFANRVNQGAGGGGSGSSADGAPGGGSGDSPAADAPMSTNNAPPPIRPIDASNLAAAARAEVALPSETAQALHAWATVDAAGACRTSNGGCEKGELRQLTDQFYVDALLSPGNEFLYGGNAATGPTPPGSPLFGDLGVFPGQCATVGAVVCQNLGRYVDRLPRTGERPFVPPKGGIFKDSSGRVKDAFGNRWSDAKDRHGGFHHDVEHPDGSHTNVDYGGGVINKDRFPSPNPKPIPPPDPASGSDSGGVNAAEAAAGAAGGGAVIWWLGKLASPVCGPLIPACAVVW